MKRIISPTDTPNPKDIDRLVERIRSEGFPHYRLSDDEKIRDFMGFASYDRSNLIKGDVIGQTLHGLGLLWTYFPHHWSIRCGKMRTPVEVWEDDELFRKAILSRVKWGGYYLDETSSPNMTPANVRKAIRTASGVQRVSNFRPTAAAAIYDRFASGAVWDMSSGFGGRLLGAIVSDRVTKYIGCDPSIKTMTGLRSIAKEFGGGKTIELHEVGSEDFSPEEESVSLCFTSPPYFDTELYADEPTQSAIRFRSASAWRDGFLKKTLRNAYGALIPGGRLVINIADVKSYPTLVFDCEAIAHDIGFVQEDGLRLALSSITKGGFKYEPVLIFKKGDR